MNNIEYVTTKDLIDLDHGKWAKSQQPREHHLAKVVRAMIAKDHWIITPHTKEKLLTSLSVAAQINAWRKQPMSDEPSEVTAKDFYILCRDFDATYDYSDDLAVWRRGEEYHAFLKRVIEAHPEYRGLLHTQPKYLFQPDPMLEDMVGDLESLLMETEHHSFYERARGRLGSKLEILFTAKDEKEIETYLNCLDDLTRVTEHITNWCNYNDLPLYTVAAPKRTPVIALPDWMPDLLTSVGDRLAEMPDVLLALINSTKSGLRSWNQLAVVVVRADRGRARLKILYGRAKFYYAIEGIDLRSHVWGETK